MQEEAEYQIKNEIHKQVKALIDENKNEIQDRLINKIIKELLENTYMSSKLKDVIYLKILQEVEERYSNKEYSNSHISWDLDLPSKLKDIYNENKEELDSILSQKLDECIKNYNIENYMLSSRIAEILTSDEKYNTILKDFLDTRIDDILDKI